MESFAFRPRYDLGDEATSYGYSPAASFAGGAANDTTSGSPRRSSAPYAASASRQERRPAGARGGGGNGAGAAQRDLMAMKRVVRLTSSLQAEQDAAEQQKAKAAEAEAARQQRERDARWEAVKARMSSNPTPLPTVRAYDDFWSSSDEEEEDDGKAHVAGVDRRSATAMPAAAPARQGTALDALVPTLTETRAVRSGPLYAVESKPLRVLHAIYNWFMYFAYAVSASMMPGMDQGHARDPKEYYSRKRYQ